MKVQGQFPEFRLNVEKSLLLYIKSTIPSVFIFILLSLLKCGRHILFGQYLLESILLEKSIGPESSLQCR